MDKGEGGINEFIIASMVCLKTHSDTKHFLYKTFKVN